MNKNYIEWCKIMDQIPNKRDEIIFMAGSTFFQIDNKKCNCDDFEMVYRCKKCNETRMHPIKK